ncbi:MAG: hypothetical protein EBT30_09365 [Verrucomicrobia bacterium]|nr:hypothetical protein [Verrucomicrobiota bacterium]
MIEQGFLGSGHEDGAAAIGHLLVPEKARRLDVLIGKRAAGILEPRGQARRHAGVHHHAFGNHIVEPQSPEPAQVRGPTELLRKQGRVQRELAGAIRQGVHATAQGNDFSLRRPARKLQQDRRPALWKGLRHERQVKTGHAPNQISQALVIHI